MACYLVTGGCGFIGLHLCKALLNRGDTIRVVDNLASGYPSRLPPEVRFFESDITDAEVIGKALAGADGCFHLAAVASVAVCNRDWTASHRTNLTGAITVFDAAKTAGIPVVYASSAAVYGDCPSLPLSEHTERRPLSPYAADKMGCELHALAASAVYRFSSVGLRFFNVYGPGQDPRSPYSGVISIFCNRIRHVEPIEIFGDGTQTRDFIFVADAVTALLGAMDIRPQGAHVLNVCTGIRTSVLDLAKTIAELCGVADLKISFRPRRPGEIAHSCGDPTAARLALGLSVPVGLRAGLAVTLADLGAVTGTTGHQRPAGRLSA